MHVHYLQDEAARVVSGRLGYQVIGEEEKFAGVGDTVVWPAGTPHKWWNAGTTELRMLGWCTPPDNIEFFLSALFASAKQNGGRPALFDAAFLKRRRIVTAPRRKAERVTFEEIRAKVGVCCPGFKTPSVEAAN